MENSVTVSLQKKLKQSAPQESTGVAFNIIIKVLRFTLDEASGLKEQCKRDFPPACDTLISQ